MYFCLFAVPTHQHGLQETDVSLSEVSTSLQTSGLIGDCFQTTLQLIHFRLFVLQLSLEFSELGFSATEQGNVGAVFF